MTQDVKSNQILCSRLIIHPLPKHDLALATATWKTVTVSPQVNCFLINIPNVQPQTNNNDFERVSAKPHVEAAMLLSCRVQSDHRFPVWPSQSWASIFNAINETTLTLNNEEPTSEGNINYDV